jgi:hypothetical protein
VAPDDVLEDLARRLVAVERGRDRLDRARGDLVALADEVGQLANDRLPDLDGGGVAVEREHVPAQVDVAVEVALERLHDHVARPGELGGDVVRELDLAAAQVSPASLSPRTTRACRRRAP